MTEQQLMNESAQSMPVDNVQPQTAPAETVKHIPQHDVDRIVKTAKASAYHQGKQDAQAELMRQQQMQTQPAEQQVMPAMNYQPQQQMGGMQQVSQDDIKRMVADHMQQEQMRLAAYHFGQEFGHKMQLGKDKYSDFESVVSPLLDTNNPELQPLWHFANATDNARDVMYDLGKNPEKATNILQIAKISPQLALARVNALSQSIKANESAQSAPAQSEPLSQIQSSNLGTRNDASEPTIRDYRKKYRG